MKRNQLRMRIGLLYIKLRGLHALTGNKEISRRRLFKGPFELILNRMYDLLDSICIIVKLVVDFLL